MKRKSKDATPFVKYLFIKWWDILFTDITRLLPCIIRWFYQLKIKRNIRPFRIEHPSGKKAMLYQHGGWNSKQSEAKTVLILHGLYSHPCVMLHLAKQAQEINEGPVFTLNLSYDKENFLTHRSLIKQALDTIESMALNYAISLKGIILAGHSLGAVEAVHAAFVDKDRRILSVISIAGRLKAVESIHSPCRESLRPSLDEIYKKIQLLPSIPLYQIVGRHDWNAPLEATLIRKEKHCSYIIEAMHFNILFHRDMSIKFSEYLTKSLSSPAAHKPDCN
jgi:hypothetical protein